MVRLANPGSPATPPRTAAAPLSYSGRPGSAPGGGSAQFWCPSDRHPRVLGRNWLPGSTPGKGSMRL